MKIFMVVLSLISFVLLSGCSSTPAKTTSKRDNVGKHKLYALLVKSDDGYTFSNLSASPGSTSEPWVRLNDMQPVFDTAAEIDCYLGFGLAAPGAKANGRTCKTDSAALFRRESMGAGNAVVNAMFLGVTMGATGTGRFTSLLFDREAYEQAVDEAIVNSSLNVAAVFRVYDGLWKEWKTNSAQISAYEQSAIRPTINVVDRSGFYQSDAIPFEGLIQVTSPKPRKPSELFPVAQIDQNTAQLIDDLADSRLRPKWRHLLASTRFSMKCGASYMHNFHFKMECPNQITVNGGKAPQVSVNVTIESRDFSNLLPARFSKNDDNLSIFIADKTLHIENLSENFLSLDSLSIYFSGKIITRPSEQRNLPPKSVHKISLRRFFGELPSSSRKRYTADKAKNEVIDFGFAAKYRVSNLGQEITLFKHDNFRGYELIKKRI